MAGRPQAPAISANKMKSHSNYCYGTLKCSPISIDELLEDIRYLLKDRDANPRIINFINAHVYNLSVHDPILRDNLLASRTIASDGMSIVWTAPLFQHSITERCNMTEAFRAFIKKDDIPKSEAVIIGGSQDIACAAMAKMNSESNHCVITHAYSGYLNNSNYKAIVEKHSNADFFFIGMGSPKSEEVARIAAITSPKSIVWHIGGGTIMFYAGLLREAPAWMRRSGLQWVHRLCLEPRRMFIRYVFGLPAFAFRILKHRRQMHYTTQAIAEESKLERLNILGVGVNAITIQNAATTIIGAAKNKTGGYVCVTGVHGIIEAQKNPELMIAHNKSFLTVPDGMPTVWFGRGCGITNIGRVYGPDLMRYICHNTAGTGLKHFLYGGRPGVAEKLKKHLLESYPGITIAGIYTPPFRPLSSDEETDFVDKIKSSKPDFLWVGLSTPKQEMFMAEHRDQLGPAIMLGVGAAFDILPGLQRDAPGWIKDSGLQWLYRLHQEPGRLWKRYFYIVPTFVLLISLQILGFRRKQQLGS